MQSCLAVLLSLCIAACKSTAIADSIWPPSDFEVSVEEVRLEGGAAKVVRRFRARADGIVSYATSSRAIVDAETSTHLPVFESLSIYRLVPTSIRALARRIDRCGILGMDRVQGERGAPADTSLVLVWQAFGRRQVVTARGRVHGAMADVLSIVMAHLPEGEAFQLPGLTDRPVVPVLRGVPVPRPDAAAALQACRSLMEQRPDDVVLMLDAFALACDLERRDEASQILQQWLDATAGERRQQQMFPENVPRLTPDVLERLLPAES